MTTQFIAAAAYDFGGSTNFDVVPPAGTADHDLLVVAIQQDAFGSTITPPAGWVLRGGVSGDMFTAWTHVVDPPFDPPSFYRWVGTSTGRAVIMQFRGAIPYDGASVPSANDPPGSTTVTTPMLTSFNPIPGTESASYVAFIFADLLSGAPFATVSHTEVSPLVWAASPNDLLAGAYVDGIYPGSADVGGYDFNLDAAPSSGDEFSTIGVLLREMPAPYVQALTPDHGVAFDEIAVTGFDFDTGFLDVEFTKDPALGGGWTSLSATLETNNLIDHVVVPSDAVTGPVRVRSRSGVGISPIDFIIGAEGGGWAVGIPFKRGVALRHSTTNLLDWQQSTAENIASESEWVALAGAAVQWDWIQDPRQGRGDLIVSDPSGTLTQLDVRSWPPTPIPLVHAGDPMQWTGMFSHADGLTTHATVDLYLGGVFQGSAALYSTVVTRDLHGWRDVLEQQSPSLAPFDYDGIALHLFAPVSGGATMLLDRLGLFRETNLTVDDWVPGA